MLLGDDLLADFARIAIRNPIQLGHQFDGPHVGRRVAVAIQAESHVERLLLMDFDLLIDAAVAADAAHARRQVRLVIKIDVVGKAVNLHPRNRLAGREAVAHQLEPRAVSFTWVWQFMQVCVAGTAANAALYTVE